MNGHNFLSILKTITESMKCPTCAHTYNIEEVQFMSQMDGYSLVHLNCSQCRMSVYVNFFSTEKKGGFHYDYIDENLGEITTDELIDFHKKLKTFDGNFKQVFK